MDSLTGSSSGSFEMNGGGVGSDLLDVVTMWATYGPYHVARVRALSDAFHGRVTPVSYCERDATYGFFEETLPEQVVLFQGDLSEIRFHRAAFRAWRSVLRLKPDLVLACGYERPETMGAMLAAKLLRIPIFLMFDNQVEDSRRAFWKERVKSAYVRAFSGFVYAGPNNARYLRRLGIPEGRETDGYDCIDNQAFARAAAQSRANESASHSNRYLLSVSRLIQKKNLVRLVQGYAGYLASVGNSTDCPDLVIVGEGPMREELIGQIRLLDLQDKVRLVGEVRDFRKMARWYAFAEALMLASHESEQWGLVVNEAMAVGLPVLVSRQSGCSSSLVMDGRNGQTFDGTDVADISAAIRWLHDNDSSKREMGEHSRQIADRYSPQEFARKVRALYERCVSPKRRADVGRR